MKRLTIAITFLVIFLVAAVGSFLVIHAQNANKGLVVYPSNFDLTYNNTPTKDKITLLNNYDQTLTIRVDLRNFTAEGEEGGVALTRENTPFSLASWISVTPQTITIPAHTSHDFTFTITPPANAEPGGHFGSIVFATVPNTNAKGTAGVAVSAEVASLILYKIPGNTKESAYVESFGADKSFYEFGPVNLSARVKNTGDIHIAPMGSVVVKGMFGDTYLIDLPIRNVLPNAVRKIPAVLTHKFLFGQYTATLIATYGTHNAQLTGSTQFFAFPVRFAVLGVIVLLTLFLLRKRLRKALKALILGK